jgi:outer membrane protein TolC
MLLEAQQRLLTLRESVTNNMTELSLQHVKLYRALGGAWKAQESAR